jgi:predicted phosphohydrolase
METLAWATDIHLNVVRPPDIDRFCRKLNESGATGLLLGGDIAEATDLLQWLEVLGETLRMPTYFVLGNHDYFGSSIERVRRQVRESQTSNLRWLPDQGLIQLSPDVCLVGHGGWADARIGDVENFPLLTDYLAIEDLFETVERDDIMAGFRKRSQLRQKLASLGDDAAAALRPSLLEAVRESARVVVLTHVPPFREACWHRGKISDEEWLPGFTCKAMGDLLVEGADSNAECGITVLCGHTHGEGYVQVRPNLDVYTAGAKYGTPYFRMVELGSDRIELKGS